MLDLRKVRITFVAGTLGLGGAERQLYYLVKGLVAAGADVRVMSLTRREYWEGRLRELGVPVVWVGESRSRLGRLRRIVKELRSDRPAILQSHHFYTNLYVVVAARLLGVREVGAVRNDAKSDVAFTGRLGSLSLRAPKLLAANSRAGVENSVALGVPRDRVCLLPNVVDTEQFEPSDRQRTGPVRLLSIGMRREKRVDRFLSVVSDVRAKSRVPVTAVVIGDGPERAHCEERAAELGLLPDVVTFRGSVAVTPADYRSADVLVLTSSCEGTPNVLLEAMASGIPVVAFRTGGVPEVVQHERSGYVIDMGNETEMAASLKRLVECPELRHQMGCNGRAFVREQYGIEHLPRILSRFYETVLS